MKTILNMAVLAALLFLTSCASIINSSRQSVPIRSTPPGATVILNDSVFGKTPMTINMKRKKKEHFIKLQLEGYETYQTDLIRVVDGWIFGNILFGGLIGLAIDAGSGGMYHLKPNVVNVELKPVATKAQN